MAGENAADGAAAACLDALAAYGDSLADRAGTRAGRRARTVTKRPAAGQLGGLDLPGRRSARSTATDTLERAHRDRAGARRRSRADVLRAVTARGAQPVVDVEQMVERAAAAEQEEQRKNGLLACAALGWPRLLSKVLEAMAGREPWLDEVGGRSSIRPRSRLPADGEYRRAPTRVRARVLRALRSSDQPEVSDLVGGELLDPDPAVRELAARTLLRRARDHGDPLPRDLAERALALQLDRFEVYVRARPGYASEARESQMEVKYRSGSAADLSAEAFFIDELERRAERSLSRLCAVLALFGNPSSVYAAERALRAPTFKRRRQALDILQEVARGRERARLLELLEIYLLPPRNVAEEAAQAVCDMDPGWPAARAAGDDPTTKKAVGAALHAPVRRHRRRAARRAGGPLGRRSRCEGRRRGGRGRPGRRPLRRHVGRGDHRARRQGRGPARLRPGLRRAGAGGRPAAPGHV
jgi:hypothetical protein